MKEVSQETFFAQLKNDPRDIMPSWVAYKRLVTKDGRCYGYCRNWNDAYGNTFGASEDQPNGEVKFFLVV